MNIGQVAQRVGLPRKTIRYYEDIGLVRAARDANGYRAYQTDDVHRLAFLGRARSLGFSINECRTLLALYADKNRASSDVKNVAQTHLDQIDSKLKNLTEMRQTLSHLIAECSGDARPDCPILADLAGDQTT